MWKGEKVIVFKGWMKSGYGGVEKGVLLKEKREMVFGEGKGRVDGMVKGV